MKFTPWFLLTLERLYLLLKFISFKFFIILVSSCSFRMFNFFSTWTWRKNWGSNKLGYCEGRAPLWKVYRSVFLSTKTHYTKKTHEWLVNSQISTVSYYRACTIYSDTTVTSHEPWNIPESLHCVKIVHIRSFFWFVFSHSAGSYHFRKSRMSPFLKI